MASESSLAEGVRRKVTTSAFDLVIVRSAGGIFAIENNCPLQHFAALHEGELDGFNLRCPMHGWTFDIRTGKPVTGEGCLKTFPVIIRGGDVWITGI